jgi:anaerobic magnesium-protoporphyrin IX monomethyl ester cyclase
VALHAGYSHSSLALTSLAAYAEKWSCEHQMALFEVLVNVNHQSLIESLVAYAPAIIGFSTYLWNINTALHLSRVLKCLLPRCQIVFGGPEAGPRGKELLLHEPSLDFVIEGEGEAALAGLMQAIFVQDHDLTQISGLYYRQQDLIRNNPIRHLPVDKIPSLRAQGVLNDQKSLLYWETSRGCPYRCSFCSSATEELRIFPLERVLDDLDLIKQYQNKTIKLLDRSFHLGKQRTLTLLKRFADTPSGLRFHLELNPDRICAEAIAILREAEPGKFQFEIGLQTLNDSVLARIERKMDVSKGLKNIQQLVSMHRHPVHLDLIVGLPGEHMQQCAQSLDRTFLLYPDHLQLGVLKLLPGTPLHAQAGDLGYRWDPDPPYEILAHPMLDFSELAHFKRYAELLERFYNSGYLRNTLAGLVCICFSNRLTLCLDRLLKVIGLELVRDNLQPDALFKHMCQFLQPYLETYPRLEEWLLWDYSHFSLVTGKTPKWIAEKLHQSKRIVVDGSRRRLPVLCLTLEAVAMINRQSGYCLHPGSYAIWPRQHKKGKPVRIYFIDGDKPARVVSDMIEVPDS